MARPPSKRKTLSNLILLSLEKSIDGYVRFDDMIHNPGLYAYYGKGEQPIKKAELARSLKRLREKGFVELISDQEISFRLTDQGRDKALWEKMRNSVS